MIRLLTMINHVKSSTKMINDIYLCIVIPCYNEGKEFLLQDYYSFLENHRNILLCFVDDGSSDDTLKILKQIKDSYSQQVAIVECQKNKGKAEAVRAGFQFCKDDFQYQYIAYLDADLSTSLHECLRLTKYFCANIEFVFGSRIAKVGSLIERNNKRFLIGRVIASIISKMLDVVVYDTQCGCKIFSNQLAKEIFVEPFISRWLFDVEIFFRILNKYGKEQALMKMIEKPLKRWVHNDDSKVKPTYFFNLWLDLYKIWRKYRSTKALK